MIDPLIRTGFVLNNVMGGIALAYDDRRIPSLNDNIPLKLASDKWDASSMRK